MRLINALKSAARIAALLVGVGTTVLLSVAVAESYHPILRIELFKVASDTSGPKYHVVLTNVRKPSRLNSERDVARFDTVSIEKDGETLRSNIFCDCGTSGPCGAPFTTIQPGQSKSFDWDGLSDMCETLEPGRYLFSASRRCQDPDASHRRICRVEPEVCKLRLGECYDYRGSQNVVIE